MSIVEKYNDLVAEYSRLANAITSLRHTLDFYHAAAAAANCAAIFKAHAFSVLEHHPKQGAPKRQGFSA